MNTHSRREGLALRRFKDMKKVIELIIGLVIGLMIGYTAGNAPEAQDLPARAQDLPAEAVAVVEALQAPKGSEAWASVTEARTREALAWGDHVYSYQNEDILGVLSCSTAGDSVPMLKILTLNRATV